MGAFQRGAESSDAMPTNAHFRLLIIDDDPDLATQIQRQLRTARTSYTIEVHDQPQASLIDRIRNGGYDACLLDHFLWDRQGADVLRSLPKDLTVPPVVVLTGASDPALSDTYLELGAADFLSKDEITPDLLDRTLRYAIGHWRARQALERSQQALLRSERLATIGRLAAGVAHEYNNLNAVILSGLEMLLPSLAGNTAHSMHLQRILDRLERSRRISQGLLQLGRASPSSSGVTDVRQQVADSIALLDGQARQAGIELVPVLSDGPLRVRINSNDIHQVVANLVTNSMHALWQTNRPRIAVRLHKADDDVVLAISDNGIGIPAEDLPRICDPFFSRKGAHDKERLYPQTIEGSGLGLAVCTSLMEQAGGTLEITSTPGMGTTVTVRLPLSKSASETAMIVATPATGSPTTGRIAVIDDNQMLLELMQEGLTLAGYTADVYHDPQRFLAAAADQHWDAVVLDWQMPHLTGGDVLARLSAAQRSEPLSFVVLSGTTPEIPSSLAHWIKVCAVLPKPFRVKQLIDALQAVLPIRQTNKSP